MKKYLLILLLTGCGAKQEWVFPPEDRSGEPTVLVQAHVERISGEDWLCFYQSDWQHGDFSISNKLAALEQRCKDLEARIDRLGRASEPVSTNSVVVWQEVSRAMIEAFTNACNL